MSPRKGRIDRVVVGLGRRVGDGLDHVIGRDDLGAMGVEQQFGDLRAAGETIRAEQRHEEGAGIGIDRHADRRGLRIHQPHQIRLAVRIAFDGGRGAAALDRLAERRILLERPRLDHHRTGICRGQYEIDRGLDFLGCAAVDQHGPAAAEQRHRLRLVGEAGGVAGQVVTRQSHQ